MFLFSLFVFYYYFLNRDENNHTGRTKLYTYTHIKV